MGDTLYPKTPAVFGIKDTRRSLNATVEESGSKGCLFNVFNEAANNAIVALRLMKDPSFPQQRALRCANSQLQWLSG